MKRNAILTFRTEIKDGSNKEGHLIWHKKLFVPWRTSINYEIDRIREKYGDKFIITFFTRF